MAVETEVPLTGGRMTPGVVRVGGTVRRADLQRQADNARWWISHLGRPGPRVADDHQITERIRWSEREHAHTAANHHVFATALR